MKFLKKLEELTSIIMQDPFTLPNNTMPISKHETPCSAGAALPHICICLDVSDSMNMCDFSPTRLEATKKAAYEFIETIARVTPLTKISLISFNYNAKIVHPAATVSEFKSSLQQAVNSLKARSATNITDALYKANSEFVMNGTPPNQSRILLLTDGDHNGFYNPVKEASKMKQQGTQIDIIGIGSGVTFDEGAMKSMASVINGKLRYWFITSTEGLVEKFQTLAIQ